MHRNVTERAPHVTRAIGLEGVSRLLDVGGGSGAYSITFAQASPADILDLASVVPIAQRHIPQAAVADRVSTRIRDLRSDSPGRSYDLVLLSDLLHAERTGEPRSARALPLGALGGRTIQDFTLEPDKTAPHSARCLR
jgi:2-polyprenyl-3-methyl-5-hydroxy-6-metoxy-1,4-benzoquinol methylase